MMRLSILVFILVVGTTQIIAGHSMSSSSAGAIFPQANEVSNNRPKRRLYGMCPPQFHRIGEQCYLLSEDKSNWLEAHFFCKDKNSKLAEPSPRSDKHLRKFLQHHENNVDKDVIWLGATYDWHNNVWQWSISGKNLTYNPFSPKDTGTNKPLDNHCAVIDPQLGYGWSARSCPDRHRFICEHKMPKVSEQNRRKVYDRWNQTYPNEFANEVLLNMHDGKRLTRRGKAITNNDHFYHEARKSPNIDSAMDVYVTLRPHRKSENDIDFSHGHSVSALATEHPKQFAKFSTILTNDIDGNIMMEPPTETSRKNQLLPRRKSIRKRIKTDLKFEHQREKERKRQQKLIERQQKQEERERKLLERKLKKEERQKRLRTQQQQQQQQLLQDNEVREEAQVAYKTTTTTSSTIPTMSSNDLILMQNYGETKTLQWEREENLREQEKQRRLIDEQNRHHFEMREKERLEEIKRQQELEQHRLALEREENMRKLEAEELSRLQEEALKRAAKEKERDDIISRRNKEAEDQESAERRLIEEVKRQEEERKREHEQIIKKEEEAIRQKELEARKKQEMEAIERRDKLEKRARAEKIRKMAERISKLSPEAQREFLEMRKKRKFKKNQQQDAQNLS